VIFLDSVCGGNDFDGSKITIVKDGPIFMENSFCFCNNTKHGIVYIEEYIICVQY
jgi:hypothetical protein